MTKEEMREEIEQFGKMYKDFLRFLGIFGKDAQKKILKNTLRIRSKTMTKEELEKEAKERAKDYTENKERQVAYECGFLDGADALEKEIKNKISEHKECCKKLAEEYRQRYNEDKTDKLALNMFYHNVIAYNNFETVLSMIVDRNSMIMCFGEPPLLTEKTVEVELNHIADLEKENAELKEALVEQKQYNAFKCEDNKKTIDNLKQENERIKTKRRNSGKEYENTKNHLQSLKEKYKKGVSKKVIDEMLDIRRSK